MAIPGFRTQTKTPSTNGFLQHHDIIGGHRSEAEKIPLAYFSGSHAHNFPEAAGHVALIRKTSVNGTLRQTESSPNTLLYPPHPLHGVVLVRRHTDCGSKNSIQTARTAPLPNGPAS